MDFLSVIIVIAAAIIGAAITYLFTRNKKPTSQSNANESVSKKDLGSGPNVDEQKIKELNEQLIQKEENIKELSESIKKLSKKIEDQKSEISEANNWKAIAESGNTDAASEALRAEREKLKKKLQDAEEEIEELEEEASSYKKKYNNERGKLSEAQQTIEQQEGQIKEIQASLESTEEELRNQSKLLEKKEEAVTFVNEVLQAKDADNKDAVEINKIVSNIQSFVENDLSTVFDKLKLWTIQEKLEAKNRLWQWANLQRKTWLQGKKVVAFVGEFSAGKTSIVNRILSQDNDNAPKLPVSSKATTAIATYISYGSDFNSQFTDPNGRLKNISKDSFERVSKDILREVNVSSAITYFVMSYKNENLQNLSILDTPGFSSNDEEDAKRTADVIKEADALFWVFDANTGEINQSSLNIIRNHLQGLPLFIVINKADTKSPKELQSLKLHIQNTIQKNGIAVVDYLFFSQNTSLDKLMTKIKSVSSNNNKDNFIFELYAEVNKLLNNLNRKLSEYRKSYQNEELNNEKISDDLNDCLEEAGESCQQVADLPEYTERWFGSDYYKITKEEYSTFINLLNNIVEQQARIDNLSEELRESSQSVQHAHDEWSKSKEERNILYSMSERFNELLSKWNSNFKQEYQSWKSHPSTNKSQNSEELTSNKQNTYNASDNHFTSDNSIINKKTEMALMSELRNLCDDYGGFTDENIPTIQALAKTYNISGKRSIELAKTLKWRTSYEK